MSGDLHPNDPFGNPIFGDTNPSPGLNPKPAYDKPGPPPIDGAGEGDTRFDSREHLWVFARGKWHSALSERIVYVVVASAGEFAMPRAWAFDDEQAAVDFRVKKLDETNRRPGSLSPIFVVPVNNINFDGYQEIDWRKHPKPKVEQKAKKFT